ncbi:sce7726 family protein [Lacticaseibacillus chiayiensis]|uniref:sce7726 family protein n=1 Tax=Lacticaseibacillus chiayiensis TaxID=2100821 RepID=UPI003C737F8F
MQKLDDPDIRAAVIKHFSRYKDVSIFEEFTTYSGKARADVVAINGHLNGIEIKSDFDSLHRLPKQIEEYNLTFERNYLIVGERWTPVVEQEVPAFWGIAVAKRNRLGRVTIRFMRQPTKNPRLRFDAILGLLDVNDIKQLLVEDEIDQKLKLNSSELRQYYKYDLLAFLGGKLSLRDKKKLISKTRALLKTKKAD